MKHTTALEAAYFAIKHRTSTYRCTTSALEDVEKDVIYSHEGSLITVTANSPALEVSMLAKLADAAARKGQRVAYINFMDSTVAVCNVVLSRRSMVPFDYINLGYLKADEWKKVSDAARTLINDDEYEVALFDQSKTGEDSVSAWLKAIDEVSLIVIDNMWMLAEPGEFWQERCELAAKRLAKKHDAVVIAGTNSVFEKRKTDFSNKVLILNHDITCEKGDNTEIILVDRASLDYKVYAYDEYIPEYHCWKSEIEERETNE